MTYNKPHECGGRPDPTTRFPIQENEMNEPLENRAKGGVNGAASDEGWILVDPVAGPGNQTISTTAARPLQKATEQSQPPRVHIVAHSKEAQNLFDTIPLSWGVQYEIARGVSQGLWSWETVIQSEQLRSLSGPSTNASRVSQVLGRSPGDPLPSDAVGSELDREDAAIIEGRGRGLGLHGEFMGQSDWYGGKVQQVAMLREVDDGFRLVLTKMEMGKSTRFARSLGSRRMLQVSIPRDVVIHRADELRAFFGQKFVLCGRVFVAFCVKGARVFLMEIPEDYERVADAPGDDKRITLMEFVAWHNPMDRNGSQLTSEWVASFDLGLSVSVPVLFIRPDNVYLMGDEVAPLDDPDTIPPAECIYTDGCGWMNEAGLSSIAHHLGLEERPTAVHGRFGGAKGLWVLHPRDQSSTPKIWIRESQVKIKLDMDNPHFAYCIFELLGLSRVTPSRLSRPVILNLAHNGVPKETFVELMKDAIDEEVKPLMQWDGPKAIPLLFQAVESRGNGRGCINYELHDQSSPGATEQPRRTIHNVILDLLSAGFHPLKLEFLFEALKKAVRLGMDDIVHYLHFSVLRSARAFIVPDPYGVLREGEIHFKSTKPFHGVDNENPHTLLGDVLIYRHPVALPSDVQKVKAVQNDVLSAYTDVVVVPIVGPRSFASHLGGADYDGDVAVVVYDDRLVKSFRPPPPTLKPHNFINDNFEVIDSAQQATVNHLVATPDQLAHDSNAHFQNVQQGFLSRLSNTAPIGLYRRFYDGSTYEHGYGGLETNRLAFMFKTLLNSQKTGHRIKEEVFERDRKQFTKELPPSLQLQKGDRFQRSNCEALRFKRDQKLGEFILDCLFDVGQKMRNEQLKHFDSLRPRTPVSGDGDLLEPWKKIQSQLEKSPPVGAALPLIQKHVNSHIREWRAIARRTAPNRSAPWVKNKAGVAKSAQAQYDELARSFAAGPEIPMDFSIASSMNIEQLKASYAYTEKPRFAWGVAFQALCHIKKGGQDSLSGVTDFAGV